MALHPFRNRGLESSSKAQVGVACRAYFPHHRQHVTDSGMIFPRLRQGSHRRPLLAPEREWSTGQNATRWLLGGGLELPSAATINQDLIQMQARVQLFCVWLLSVQQQAQSTWQSLLSNWPAWQLSLKEDTEVVLEYAYGLVCLCLMLLYTGFIQCWAKTCTWQPLQRAQLAAVIAIAAVEARAAAAKEAVVQRTLQVSLLLKSQAAAWTKPQQPSQHGLDQQDAGFASDDGRRVAARVAYSIAWFGFGRHSGAQHSQPLAQQLSQYDWQKLQQQQLYEAAAFQTVRPRRWKQAQRREWVDRVVSRARKHTGASSSISTSHHLPTSDNLWRAQSDHQFGIGAVRQAAGALLAAQKGVQQCAEALHAASCSAACKAQATSAVLVTPLQQAVQFVKPPPPGLMAAGVVLLVGMACNTFLRRQQEAALLAQQQQRIQEQRSEALRAQKARILGALNGEVSTGASSGRRKSAAATARTSSPSSVAQTVSPEPDEDADTAAAPHPSSNLPAVELDPEAAAMWGKFLAGSRATGVPMWDNRMVEDLPKVSRREMDKHTQKIRSAAAPEETAAIEQADMEQLTKQLQQLDHAPVGRQARAAWLKEQQKTRQAPQQQADDTPVEGSTTADAGKVPANNNSNPFAIDPEVRARWDADLEVQHAKPASSKPAASRKALKSSGGNNTTERRSPDSSKSNPFAISHEARAQWEADDHMFSEPAAKPMLGPMVGGWLTAFTSGKARPSEMQQHQQRRREALKAEKKEAAAIMRLQQQEQQQQMESSRAGASRRPLKTAVQAADQMQQAGPESRPASTAPASAHTQACHSATETSTAAALQEGSPEWNEKMRQDMMRSGAARRARMQQQRAVPGRPAITEGQAAEAQTAPRQQASRVLGTRDSFVQDGMKAASEENSSRESLQAVSAADARSVTAAIPSAQRLNSPDTVHGSADVTAREQQQAQGCKPPAQPMQVASNEDKGCKTGGPAST